MTVNSAHQVFRIYHVCVSCVSLWLRSAVSSHPGALQPPVGILTLSTGNVVYMCASTARGYLVYMMGESYVISSESRSALVRREPDVTQLYVKDMRSIQPRAFFFAAEVCS